MRNWIILAWALAVSVLGYGCVLMRNLSDFSRYEMQVERFDKAQEQKAYPNGDILAIYGTASQNRLFISANGLGLLMSQDQGQHWQKRNG